MVRVLVFDSPFDTPTRYLATAMNKIAAGAQRMGAEAMQIRGPPANFFTLVDALQSFQPELVFIGGHGSSNLIMTSALEPLLVACENDEVMAGVQSYFISCLSGIALVPSVVRKGGVASAGFTEEFAWVISPPFIPESDPTWQPFERLLVESALAAIRGGGARGWFNRLQAVAAEEERRWGAMTEPIASQVLMYLRQDKRAATWTGEGGGEGGGILPIVLLLGLLSG